MTDDPDADAAYLTLGDDVEPGRAVSTVNAIGVPNGAGEINLDFDAAGRLLGVEVLGASALLAPELLEAAAPPLG